jgi:hypothetical protein
MAAPWIMCSTPYFFFRLIALELPLDRWRGVGTYCLADALSSLSAGVLSTTSGWLTEALA